MVSVPNQLLITSLSSECIDAFILTKQQHKICSFPRGIHVDQLVIKSMTAFTNATVMSDMYWLIG